MIDRIKQLKEIIKKCPCDLSETDDVIKALDKEIQNLRRYAQDAMFGIIEDEISWNEYYCPNEIISFKTDNQDYQIKLDEFIQTL